MNNTDTPAGNSVVLLYHRIGPVKLSSQVTGQYVSPRVLGWGIDEMLRRKWQPVSLDDCIHCGRENNEEGVDRFAMTFDDGFLSVYEHAYPMLKERGITATIYIVVDTLGGINDWDRRAGDVEERMMSAQQMKELAENGFEIGSHTLTHPRLAQLDDEQLMREITDSKHRLEDLLGKEVTSLSYPYGNFDNRVLQAAVAAGYKNAVSTILGTVIEGTSLFEVPRVNVRWNGFGWQLRRKINRAIRASRLKI